MADHLTTLTFAELEFVLRSAGERGRSETGDAGEVGVAVARSSAGAWFMSDSLERPDPGRPIGREAVVARLQGMFGDLIAQPVGV